MSSASRLGALALLALALGGCGLHPLHGAGAKSAAGFDKLRQVEILPIADRSGQILRNYLMDRIGDAEGASAYTLYVSLGEQRTNTGIALNSSATFAELLEIADFRLTDKASGKVLFAGQSVARDSYSLVNNGFGSLTAEGNARGQVLNTVGDDIIARVGLFLDRAG